MALSQFIDLDSAASLYTGPYLTKQSNQEAEPYKFPFNWAVSTRHRQLSVLSVPFIITMQRTVSRQQKLFGQPDGVPEPAIV